MHYHDTILSMGKEEETRTFPAVDPDIAPSSFSNFRQMDEVVLGMILVHLPEAPLEGMQPSKTLGKYHALLLSRATQVERVSQRQAAYI